MEYCQPTHLAWKSVKLITDHRGEEGSSFPSLWMTISQFLKNEALPPRYNSCRGLFIDRKVAIVCSLLGLIV